jgi:hypothetical protein
MRESFETMRQDYQKSMDALAERLRRLEAESRPVTAEASEAARTRAAATPAPAVSQVTPSTPSTVDLLRPRQPFGLYTQRSPGQLLFDIGLSGDFIGNITQRNVDKADAGTFARRENRFFPREAEMNLFGQIDPYALGVLRIEAGEEDAAGDVAVRLAEAHLTLLTLPFNTQLKMGQTRARFGLLNEHHRDGLPQPDVPNVLVRFLGEEGLVERGAELTWLPPLPFYLEVLASLFNGDNETAFGRGKLSEPLATGRVRTFFELGDEHALQLGASVASGLTAERQRSVLPGLDVRYKYRPDGWLHPLLTLSGEALWAIRRAEVSREVLIDTDGDDVPDTTIVEGAHRTRRRFGWYVYGEVQPVRRWAGGVRYDYVEPLLGGRERAIEPYITFLPSDFLRFRLAYKHTERSQDIGFSTAAASARRVDELLFQATFTLGAHPVHPF